MRNNKSKTDNFITNFCEALEQDSNQNLSHTIAKEITNLDENLNFGERFSAVLNKEDTKK